MNKRRLKVFILLLGVFAYLMLLQTEAITDVKPPEGLVIALRAPTSGASRLVKCPGSENEKVIEKGFSLSLPEDTPIFFRVDQVNTVLYTIEIKVTEDRPKAVTSKSPDFSNVLGEIKKIIGLFSPMVSAAEATADDSRKMADDSRKMADDSKATADAFKAEVDTLKAKEDAFKAEVDANTSSTLKNAFSALTALEEKIKAIRELNRKLDKLLHQSESPQFYGGDIEKAFAGIQEQAERLTRKSLKLPEGTPGTPQAICDAAAEAIERVHSAFKKTDAEYLLFCLPKDLSETSNELVAAVLATAGKLQRIEMAKWTQTDTETRFLKDEIKYTCIFTPREENPNIEQITRVVTVKGYPTGWIIKFTEGAFLTKADKPYFLSPPSMNGTKSREIMAEDDKLRVTPSAGALVHVLHSNLCFVGIAPALTTGLAVDGAKDFQVVLGGSILFNAFGDRTVALTGGGIVRKATVLRAGYSEESEFKGETPPTEKVPRVGWFAAITLNFDSFINRKGDSKSSKN